MNPISQHDPEVWQAIAGEQRRQQDGLELIASENYTSSAVMAAQGTVLTNNQNNRVLHLNLEFYQAQRAMQIAQYYKLETSVTRRVEQ